MAGPAAFLQMITFENFGNLRDTELLLFTLKNSSGAYVELTNYGAAIVSVVVPDKRGKQASVVLGFDEPEGYLEDTCYIGSTIGRFANRIANARFTLDGNEYHLDANDNGNSNHGGKSGFNYCVFDYEIFDESVIFRLVSADGDGGFPGRLNLELVYEWTEDSQLKIAYIAETDKPTIVNFTNHAYFNLSGQSGSMLNHHLTINANMVLEADAGYIPTGRQIEAGSKAFRNDVIGKKMDRYGIKGFNDYYILDDVEPGLKKAATLNHAPSGRAVNIYTTYPGLMFYAGDYLQSNFPGHAGKFYGPFEGLCLECQFYPDAPNHSHFPSTVLYPGERYHHQIIYEFTVTNNAS